MQNKLGERIKLKKIFNNGLIWFGAAQALQGVEAPTEAVVTLTPTKFTFELEGEPDNAADLKLIIMASAPQSNGVTRAYGKAAALFHLLLLNSDFYNTCFG